MTQSQVRWRTDVAVAVIVAIVTCMDVWWSAPGTRSADALSYGLLAITVAAVFVRRAAPVTVTLVCAAVLTAWTVLGHRGELLNLPTMVALFTVATEGTRRRTVAVGVVAMTWSALLGTSAGGWSSAPATELVWPAAALLLGEVVRNRHELQREYAEREARATVELERDARDRIQQERIRIAREVHDVVAHTMSCHSGRRDGQPPAGRHGPRGSYRQRRGRPGRRSRPRRTRPPTRALRGRLRRRPSTSTRARRARRQPRPQRPAARA